MSVAAYDHMGWMLCDGRALSTSTFAQLYRQIGTQFGSDGPNTFRLPDMRGAVAGSAGLNDVAGGDLNAPTTRAIGDATGTETHTLTVAELPKHNHDISGGDLSTTNVGGTGRTSIQDTSHTHNYQDACFLESGGSGTNNIIGNGSADSDNGLKWRTSSNTVQNTPADIATSNQSADHRHTIASNGNNQPHNNMQPTVFLGNTFIYTGFVRFPSHLITENVVRTRGPYSVDPSNRIPY